MKEPLAAYAHEAWAAYMDYFLGKCDAQPDGSLLIPAGYVAALCRQIATPYSSLTEQEKGADREEADKILAIIGLMDGE